MSIRADSSSLIAGAVVVGDPGLGVLAEHVPSTGEHGAGYLFPSLEFPADAGKEVRGLITTWPTLGTMTAFEDSSFEYDGPPDTFAFQMYVNGQPVGTPQTVTTSEVVQTSQGSSIRVDSSSLIAGAVVVGGPGLGVLAEDVPSTGEHGPGYLYDSLELPADNGKEVRGLITRWPTLGTLTAFEDSGFEYDGESDTFAFQLYVGGVAVGTPQTVTIRVGEAAPIIVAPVTGHAISTGYTPLVLQVAINPPGFILPLTGSGIASGYAPVITQGTLLGINPVTGHAVSNGYAPVIIEGEVIFIAPLTGNSSARGYSPYVSIIPRKIGPQCVLYLKVNT